MDANNAYPATGATNEAASTAQQRSEEALRVAGAMFRQGPDWVTFFREVLGVGGAVRRLFPSQEELVWFEQTEEYAEIQQMVAQLRTQVVATTSGDDKEPTRVITVRLPRSMHELLRREAHDRSTSMNKLCISKLLQVIDEELVPNDLGDAVAKQQVKITRIDPAHGEPGEPHQQQPAEAARSQAPSQPHIYGGYPGTGNP